MNLIYSVNDSPPDKNVFIIHVLYPKFEIISETITWSMYTSIVVDAMVFIILFEKGFMLRAATVRLMAQIRPADVYQP